MAKEKSWKALVDQVDPEKHKKEYDVYTFSGKGRIRKFKDRKDPYESAKN